MLYVWLFNVVAYNKPIPMETYCLCTGQIVRIETLHLNCPAPLASQKLYATTHENQEHSSTPSKDTRNTLDQYHLAAPAQI